MENWKVVNEDIEDWAVIKQMADTNEGDYNIDKTIEEIFELGEALMKRKLKGEQYGASNQHIIDEIGDVQIRINVLREILGPHKVDERVKFKLAKFRGFYKDKKYIGRI